MVIRLEGPIQRFSATQTCSVYKCGTDDVYSQAHAYKKTHRNKAQHPQPDNPKGFNKESAHVECHMKPKDNCSQERTPM